MPKLEIGGSYFKQQCATTHSTCSAAFGDLTDNARDAGATDVYIDVDFDKHGKPLMVHVTDNGPGAHPRDLLQIISVSRSKKNKPSMQEPGPSSSMTHQQDFIGGFGFGLKGGIFKLGLTGLVLTVMGGRAAAALLSIPYNEEKEHAGAPCVVWVIRADGSLVLDIDTTWADKDYDGVAEEEDILKYGPFKTREELYNAVADIGEHGFMVIISDIRPAAFRVEGDTVIFSPSHESEAPVNNPSVKRPRKDQEKAMMEDLKSNETLKYPLRDDLRVYLSHLYLDGGGINVHLMGKKVKVIDPYSLLVSHKKMYDKYLLVNQGGSKEGAWKLTLGFWAKGTEAKKDFGLMMYKDKRLVEYYKKYGIMNGRGGSGNWIQGVVEVPRAVEHVLTKDRFSNSIELTKVENQIKKVISSWYNEAMKEDRIKKQGVGEVGLALAVKGDKEAARKGKRAKAQGVAAKKDGGKKRKVVLLGDDDEDDGVGDELESEEEGYAVKSSSNTSIPVPGNHKVQPTKGPAAPLDKKRNVPQANQPLTLLLPPPASALAVKKSLEACTQTQNIAAVDGASSKVRGLEQQIQLLLKASADQMERGDILEREKIQLETELAELKRKIRDNHLQCFFGGTPAKGQAQRE
jgi:hypothetical protein